MHSSIIYIIHIAIIAFYAAAGFFIGLSFLSTALGLGVGLVIAAILWAVWGRHALAANV